MSQESIRKKVDQILSESPIGTMATVKNDKPHSRYMLYFHRELILYTATDKETDKVEEIELNPWTHILIGYEGEGFGDEYVEYQGKVSIESSLELKKELWNEDMKKYFSGPEDSSYTLLKVEPTAIRVMNKKGESPKELHL
ncbi:general stress protein [Oceanobacillus sp. E9]|uniref:General stress protein 26 n=1 Tax=Oceanobacillus kimchii TaxID=746691 RepID=A0ABQ5TLY8_9BACI|nr:MULTISPECIES: pyridoxamine 5'-phosphate oxidase family protein [Oceanobacillus]MBT2599608.1 pyridoxamine 5'-phosphate oxidase family protein [Oceanobacillus sp. ISL-74]OEH56155.1 general stress protein [Oceanobacillus sp. E9]GLO67833.1 general stress protein 26 [Oceanobacillus kimchii]